MIDIHIVLHVSFLSISLIACNEFPIIPHILHFPGVYVYYLSNSYTPAIPFSLYIKVGYEGVYFSWGSYGLSPLGPGRRKTAYTLLLLLGILFTDMIS